MVKIFLGGSYKIKTYVLKILPLLFSFFLFFEQTIKAMDGSDQEKVYSTRLVRFKLGLEFQESSGLCPWALNNNNIQKKPFFTVLGSVFGQIKKLFHVEIDGTDIEFVTKPFSNEEGDFLNLCTELILASVSILEDLLNQKREITFSDWTNQLWMLSRLSIIFIDYHKYDGLFSKADLYGKPIIRPSYELLPLSNLPVSKVPEKKKIYVERKGDQIEYTIILPDDQFIQHSFNIQIIQSEISNIIPKFLTDNFLNEHKNVILEKIPSKYTPCHLSFSPQATIQHPLHFTIPLYLSLFGDDPFILECLPKREALKAITLNTFKKTFGHLYVNPQSGLFFLHASTLLGMVSPKYMIKKDRDGKQKTILITDSVLLELTHDSYTLYNQVDPKGNLPLISRRPFSEMYGDIPGSDNYRYHWEQGMPKAHRKLQEDFYNTNYAEQFFNIDGTPLDCTQVKDYLDNGFVNENQEILDKLLSKGIISTAMIRNFKNDIKVESDTIYCVELLDQFYGNSLSSVSDPINRYMIDENLNIKLESFKYDGLSPPWFLKPDNSIGLIKDIRSNKDQDQTYGEAIVEMRGIYKVDKWFLDCVGLPGELHTVFLRNPRNNLVNQVNSLFNFLKNFDMDSKNTQERIALLFLN